MIDPTCIADDIMDPAGLRPLHRWHVDLASDAIESDRRLWAMPGIYRHRPTPSAPYIETHLPTLEHYIVRGADLSSLPAVRLPEGARGGLAAHEEELWCVRSPLAALPCEGPPLSADTRIPAQHGVELGPGHVWSGEILGQHCMRCGCRAGFRPLRADTAPLDPVVAWSRDWRWWARGEQVDCVRGDERTRHILRDNLTTYLSGGFGEQIYVTTPAQRVAMVERASSQVHAGGRWLLADDVTPETAPDVERPLWVDLAALMRETPTAQRSPAAFDLWAAGTGSAPRELMWVAMWGEVKPRLAALVAADGPPVYVDARAMLAALRRSWLGETRYQGHPAEHATLDLRNLHDARPRQNRPSLLVLFPAPDDVLDREVGLRAARALWSSGR